MLARIDVARRTARIELLPSLRKLLTFMLRLIQFLFARRWLAWRTRSIKYAFIVLARIVPDQIRLCADEPELRLETLIGRRAVVSKSNFS